MIIRGIKKEDFDYVVSVLDRWWGGPSGERAHPIFFYELGEMALIAEEGGEVLGFLLGFLAPTQPPVAYVHLVGIHPDHRRRGVGKDLYEHFTRRARAAGAERIKAITTVGNEGSIRFHEALGFAVREDPDYAGAGRSRVVFTKDL
ncbi:MAG: GNAT family N-acetyltransferase [Sandaracinaceae bacterium]|nr:GNAT family N-acetyltransferase [Sandaracinaceae bacterium]